MWTALRTAITETASTEIAQNKKLRMPWLSSAAGELIEKKRFAAPSSDKRERNKLRTEIDSLANEDRESYYNKIAEKAETAVASNNLKPIARYIVPSAHCATNHRTVMLYLSRKQMVIYVALMRK